MRIDIDPDDLEEYIEDVLNERLKYLKTYEGVVTNNTANPDYAKGAVQVSVFDLGWTEPDQYVWADPEFATRGWMIPAVGDEVKIYFYKGDPELPVYRGYFYYDLSNTPPETSHDKGVLIKTKNESIEISFDDTNGDVNIKAGTTGKITLETDIAGIGKIEIDQSGIILGQGLGGPIACVGTNSVNTLIGPMPILPGVNTTSKA